MEPIYIAQSAEPRTTGELRAWFRARAEEGREQGCTWFRYSTSDEIECLALVEGWAKRPPHEGKPRWQLVPSPEGDR